MKHLSLAKPHLIVTVGIPGCGKSFFAEKFASTFGAPRVSQEKLADFVQGDIKAVMELQLDELLKTNQSIIYDGAAESRTERSELAKKARQAGYSILYVWVQTDEATAKARFMQTHKHSSSEEYTKALKHFTPPNTIEKPLVVSGKHTYATQAKVVLKRLSAPRTEISGHQKAPIRPDRGAGRIVVR
ncbi:MAG TPA: AAA family ATPase [Candidatus Saccharimonadales bacterium]|nr:AAA family ATPase [Candidatus Saccharimonadales bacterium]